jgi:hypothetical protein
VVESQRNIAIPGVDHRRVSGVVAGLRCAFGPGDEHRRYRVQPGISRGIGVDVELAAELDVERCLLAGFPDRGRLERLAVVDEAAGQGPAGRRVLTLDEDDAPPFPAVHHLDDDVDGGHGIAELPAWHGFSRLVSWPAAPIVGGSLRTCQSLLYAHVQNY